MKTLICLLAFALFTAVGPQAVAKDESSKEMTNTQMVPSGTYMGTAERVDPKEKEIYVKTNDGKLLELYFSEQTKLTEDGKEVQFDALKKGQKVEVKLENKGNRLEPLSVKIGGGE